tara:strand:+ start:300 stop:1598 length:1299 start_codon:yes stop_codon:yes gene_type:complete
MSKPRRTERTIPLDRIFLHHENPRHEPYETQGQVIEYLCKSEEVPQLARDVAQHGLSPFDRFGVVLDHDDGDDSTYIAAEGNRRVCALKLLTDPELSPPERKKYFEKLAETWTPISELPCVIFDDEDDLDLWLKRRHHGTAGGIGLKAWNSEQQARHSGSDSRNRVALEFLDYAESENLISSDDRKRRLTTVQRYLGNPVMRETMGLDTSDPDDIKRNRSEEDFKLLSKKFIEDMLDDNKDVNSRQNKGSIEQYARELSTLPGQNRKRVEPEPIQSEPATPKQKRRSRPGKAKRPQRLPWESDIRDALKGLGNWKLESIYHSICDVSLQENTPLLAVGVWSFFETLTAKAGRNPQTDFYSFLSASRLSGYGLGNNQSIKPLRDALQRIQNYGNTTKHHDTAAAFNGDQLYNDIESLKGLILKIIEDAVSEKN